MKKTIEFGRNDFKVYVGAIVDCGGMSGSYCIDILDALPDEEFLKELSIYNGN